MHTIKRLATIKRRVAAKGILTEGSVWKTVNNAYEIKVFVGLSFSKFTNFLFKDIGRSCSASSLATKVSIKKSGYFRLLAFPVYGFQVKAK